MLYQLVAIVLSITTGDVVGVYPLEGVYKDAATCLAAQADKPPQKPQDGHITVFQCSPLPGEKET